MNVTTVEDPRSDQKAAFAALRKDLASRSITLDIEYSGQLHDRQIMCVFPTAYIFVNNIKFWNVVFFCYFILADWAMDTSSKSAEVSTTSYPSINSALDIQITIFESAKKRMSIFSSAPKTRKYEKIITRNLFDMLSVLVIERNWKKKRFYTLLHYLYYFESKQYRIQCPELL